MRPQPITATLSAARQLARVLPGLALVVVVAGCGADEATAPSTGTNVDAVAPVAAVPSTNPSRTVTATLTSPTPPEEEPDESADPPASNSGGYGIRIPRLNVTAPVVPITMTAQRALQPPRDPAVLGWWSEGAAPGARTGSAVLVGHSVRTGGGALNELAALSQGDAIEVNGWGTALTYRVQSVEVLSKDQVARDAERIFNQSGSGRLVVITCEDWDGSVWRSNVITVATPA